MTPLSDFQRRFDYHFWAIDTLIDALSNDEAHASARGYLAHALVADHIWFSRIKTVPLEDVVLLPDLGIEEMCRLVDGNRQICASILPQVDPDAIIHYTSTKGRDYKSSVGDVLNHILLHSMYHRGQVATALRALDTAPPVTDYIAWVRAID